jgi:DNA polymerase eta
MSTDRSEPPAKRRRTNKGNIANFFGPKDAKRLEFDAARAVLQAHSESTGEDVEDTVEEQGDEDLFDDLHDQNISMRLTPFSEKHHIEEGPHRSETPPSAQPPPHSHSTHTHHFDTETVDSRVTKARASAPQQTLDQFFCPRCNIHLPVSEQAEHIDYHFALDLSKEMRQETRDSTPHTQVVKKPPTGLKLARGRGRPPGSGAGRGGGVEKGQAKLAFGRRE